MTGDQGAIALAERVLSILDEGSFSATYKFALFIAILDLCIEKTERSGAPPTSLTTRELAKKVVEICWNHVTPYAGLGTLRFGGGKGEQAEIMRRIEHARARWADGQNDTVQRASQTHAEEFAKLVDFVEWKLIQMPIPRLQVLGGQEDQFLYRYNWTRTIKRSTVSAYQRQRPFAFGNKLDLLPGVAESLTKLNGILRPLFYREWAVMVARMNKLPEAALEGFLFGSERTSLDAVRGPLRELQDKCCFYCGDRFTSRADVDHFIPWSRYPDDGLDNLVAAHPKCNNNKRDFLASAEHVEHWVERQRMRNSELTAVAQDVGWHRDAERSASVAAAIYLRLPATARLWRRSGEFVPVERDRIARALQ